MQVRSPSQLRRDQAQLLLDNVSSEPVGTVEGAPPAGISAQALGRVSQVITSDATYGPHLRVVAQVHAGIPPAPTDASTHDSLRYPTPGRTVVDYTVGEYVWLFDVEGARLAAKLV